MVTTPELTHDSHPLEMTEHGLTVFVREQEYLPAMKNTDWEYKRHEVVVEAVFKNDATVR